MFGRKKQPKLKPTPSAIEWEINRLHDYMETIDPISEEYAIAAKRLKTLYKIRDQDFKTSKKKKEAEKKHLIPPALQGPLLSGALTGGLIVLTKAVEFDGPITTKGWGFIGKGRA